MMSKNDKTLDHPVGAIHELPEHIGAVGRGDSRIARAIRELPHALVFSAPMRANLFCFGSPGLK